MKNPGSGKRSFRVSRKVLTETAILMILAVILSGLLGLSGYFYSTSWATSPSRSTPVVALGSKSSPLIRSDIGFFSRQKLIDHYEKHGREFGAITMEEYLFRAKTLRDRPIGGKVLEFVRSDGVITRFDRTNGDFIAFNPDGVIRTFFRPSAGEAYFRRQAREKKRV